MPEGPSIRILVAPELPEHWRWIGEAMVPAPGIAPAILCREGAASAEVSGAPVHRVPDEILSSGRRLPAFGRIVSAVEETNPSACLLFDSSPFAALVRSAADLLSVPVFSFVTTEEELANMPRRSKPKPDLFFVAKADLLPAALEDSRYGMALFPVRDPAAPKPAEIESGETAGFFDIVSRWASGSLDASPPELSVVVPAFRESKNLSLVTARLLQMLDESGINGEIILVDDASPDDTYAAALGQMWRSPRVRAITKKPPRGMGNAIRHGIVRARAQVIGVTMGDGSDEVSRIPEMFARIQEGYGLAIGCRYGRRENYETIPLLYRFWSRCFRLTTWALIGLHLKDYTNAFRLFHRRIFDRYGVESGGFEISPEITFKAWFATRRIAEVDVRHLKRASGQSKFSFLRAGPGYGKILLKALVNRFTGRWFTLDW